MVEQKLVVCIMGQNCEKFIRMCLESVKDVDAIIYCDGGSTDNTLDIVNSFRRKCRNTIDNIPTIYPVKIIQNKYDQEDKLMNGKQRNFYLNYLKNNCSGWWALCLDADEVVDDLSKIKDFINQVRPEAEDILFSVKMRHFIGDLGNEDATQSSHFVPHRLFKIRENLIYPEVEHPVLLIEKSDEIRSANIQPTTIWHLAYIPNLFEYKKKYENHLKKSDMHTPVQLKQWYFNHIFGQYPKSKIDLMDIPEIIFDEFGIDKDEFYFMNRRQVELKHFFMMKDWLKHFKPKKILDIGCGFGLYGAAGKMLQDDLEYTGIEKSKFIIENWPYKDLTVVENDITKGVAIPDSDFDLVLVLDILEHLPYDCLDFSLRLISSLGKNFIFSIPFIGDENLEADKTHIIKESKEWWIEKLGKYFKIKDVPKEWIFSNQLLVGEIKDG